jgi:putative FmdB family regulatory protein
MPTYEYECKSCGHTFDVFQRMSDPPLTNCPQCGQALRRLINGGSGVIFKGSGFYVTDKHGGSSGTASPAKPAAGEGQAPQGESPAASSDLSAPAGEKGKTETGNQSSGSGVEKKIAG